MRTAVLNIYWGLLLTFSTLSLLESKEYFGIKTKQKIILITAFILILFVGLRYNSIDYISYNGIYNSTSFSMISFPFYQNLGSGREFLYASITSGFKYFNLPFSIFIFIFAFISLSIKFRFFYKYSPYFFLTLLLYFSFSIHKDMGQIRNAMVAAILLFSVIPIVQRKFWHFLFITLMAFGVQSFALIILPLYWLYPHIKKRKTIIGLLILSIIAFYLGGLVHLIKPIFIFLPSSKVISYLNNPHYLNVITVNINMIFLILLGTLLTILKKTYIQEKSFYEGLYFYYMYGLILYLIASDLSIISARAVDIFCYIPLSILVPYIIHQIDNKKIKIIIYFFTIFFSIVRFIPTSNSMHSYQNILFLSSP